MCLFICANPSIDRWLYEPVDHAYRKALELKPLLAADLLEADDTGDDVCVCIRVFIRRPSAGARIARRVAFIPISPLRSRTWRASSPLEKPLDALANTWTRFLFWIGWRRR